MTYTKSNTPEIVINTLTKEVDDLDEELKAAYTMLDEAVADRNYWRKVAIAAIIIAFVCLWTAKWGVATATEVRENTEIVPSTSQIGGSL